jgi:hypothetical protein
MATARAKRESVLVIQFSKNCAAGCGVFSLAEDHFRHAASVGAVDVECRAGKARIEKGRSLVAGEQLLEYVFEGSLARPELSKKI